LIDELGAVDGLNPAAIDPLELLVTVPMIANAAGAVTITGNPADILPAHEVTLFNAPGRVDAADQSFAFDTLTVVLTPPASAGANTLTFDMNGDGAVSPIDALMVINELTMRGARPLGATDSGRRMDFNGDGFISPLDALAIVNQLLGSSNTLQQPPRGIVEFDESGGGSAAPYVQAAYAPTVYSGQRSFEDDERPVESTLATHAIRFDQVLDDIAADVYSAWSR
jgi:hypothetical protein